MWVFLLPTFGNKTGLSSYIVCHWLVSYQLDVSSVGWYAYSLWNMLQCFFCYCCSILKCPPNYLGVDCLLSVLLGTLFNHRIKLKILTLKILSLKLKITLGCSLSLLIKCFISSVYCFSPTYSSTFRVLILFFHFS